MTRASRLLALVVAAGSAAVALDHSAWDALLQRFVTPDSRVDYRAWKAGGTAELDEYLKQLARPWPPSLPENEKKAALINAYNALTIRWILQHYPVESIWRTPKPFTAARHTVDGRSLSLDSIETRLRDTGDARIHSALVCAARSCPPLRREAWTGARLDQQLDANTREWLSNPSLNSFHAARRTAEVSSIFKWYREDFERSGGLQSFLARHAASQEWLKGGPVRIAFKDYHWGLNDTSTLGADYGGMKFRWDWLRNR